MGYSFGKDLSVTYYPTDQDGDPIVVSAEAPEIHLFPADVIPTREDAIAGVGALETITSWNKDGNGYRFTVPAIEEPDANESRNTHEYELAIKFTLQAGADVQMRRMVVHVSRPLGYDNELNITTQDIEAHFDTVDDWITETKQNAFIDAAITWVKGKLKEKGYRLAKIKNPEVLRDMVINRALFRIALAAIANGNQGFNVLMTESKIEYQSALKSVRLLIDENQDGRAEAEIVPSGHIRIMI